MSKTRISVIGYPRIGSLRELKFASEKYFAKEISQEELNKVAHELKLSNWHTQKNDGIDFISSNDFSFYDGMLDTAFMLGAIPERYKKLGLSKLDTFFAMARGYQEGGNDVTALPMKKWFNTNYHYIVPEFDDSTELALDATKILEEFNEAKETGTETKINVIGPYTFLKLAHYKGTKNLNAYAEKAANLYKELLAKAAEAGAKWIQIEEPALVHDTTADDRVLFEKLYKIVLDGKKLSVLLETYFGDIRDSYKTVTELPFDAIGLDFIEGKETLNLLQKEGFPKDKILFAGVVNGKNIWKNNYAKTIELVNKIKAATEAEVVLSTSCSLLHVPYTIRNEIKLSSDILKHFSFAREKLFELTDLSRIIDGKDPNSNLFNRNQDLFKNERVQENSALASKINGLGEKDYTRLPAFEEREEIQKNALNLPLFPTTTIGSFPQTKDVRANRSAFKKGQITAGQYKEFNKTRLRNALSFRKSLVLTFLFTANTNETTWLNTLAKTLKDSSLQKKRGFSLTEHAA